MTQGTAAARFFTPMAFDFVWENLELGEVPYPLNVGSHGATVNERASLRHQVDAQLKTQSVKDSFGRVDPEIEQGLTMLARGSSTIDAHYVPEMGHAPVAAIAATDTSAGVLAVQDSDGIWLRRIFPEAPATEMVGLLPGCKRGTERSITISKEEAARTAPEAPRASSRRQRAEPESGGGWGDRLGLGARKETRPRASLSERTAGDQRQDYARLAGQPRLRGGQFAVNARNTWGTRTRSPVLAWFDTDTGRYLSLTRQGPDGHEWVTVSPADAKTLRSRLADMAGELAR